MKNQELGNVLHNIYKFSEGLGKTHFQWTKSPKNLQVLAGTDESGFVKWYGQKYYVSHDWKTNSIEIELA